MGKDSTRHSHRIIYIVEFVAVCLAAVSLSCAAHANLPRLVRSELNGHVE